MKNKKQNSTTDANETTGPATDATNEQQNLLKSVQRFMKKSEFARVMGITPASITDAVYNKRIELDERGLVDFEKYAPMFMKNKTLPHIQGQLQKQISNIINNDEFKNLTEARLEKEKWTAKLKKLEYEKANDNTFDLDDVKNIAIKFSRSIRENILNIPDRVSADVSAKIRKKIISIDEKLEKYILQSDIENIVYSAWVKESKNILEDLAKPIKLN